MKKFALGFASALAALAMAIPGANAAILGYNWQGTFTTQAGNRNLFGAFEVDDAFQQGDGSFESDSLRSFTLNLDSLFPQLSNTFGPFGDLDVLSLVTDGVSTLPGFGLDDEGFDFTWTGETGAPQFFGFLFAEESSKTVPFLGDVNAAFGAILLTNNGNGGGTTFVDLPAPGLLIPGLPVSKDVEKAFQVSNFTVTAKDGSAAVPEPTTMLGLGLAGAGIAALKKRQGKPQEKVAIKR